MTAAVFRKHLNALRPVDDAGDALLSRIKLGQDVMVEVKRPRNPLHHRKLFAMLKIVLDNQEFYKSTDDLLEVCKLRVGHVHVIETKGGDVRIPKSISFASMPQDEFNAFYDKAVQWVVSEVIPGLQRGDLDEAVERELIGFGG